MARTTLLSALLTKRGVIIALVVGVGVLGAGFGFLPALLGGADDAGASPSETTRQPDETVETANGQDDTETATERGGTPPSAATTERSDNSARTGGGTAGGTRTTDGARTTDGRSTADETTDGRSTADDRPRRDPDPGGDDDGPAAVGVRAESNASASSLADYPSRSRKLNAVVNPPNTARTAGGA